MRQPIIGFIHIYAVPLGIEIFNELLAQTKASGLYDATDRIFVGVLGPDWQPEPDPKIESFHNPDGERFEIWTLQRMHDECSRREGLVWYANTKGAAKTPDCKQQYAEWRRTIAKTVITDWRECVRTMEDEAVDACGPLFAFNGVPFFAGNFWWTRCSYVRTLVPPEDWVVGKILEGMHQHYASEVYVTSNAHKRLIGMTAFPSGLK